MPVEWNAASMGTGIRSVDDQHKQLIGTLNMLVDKLRAGNEDEAVGPLLESFEKYTTEHFDHEEKCMDVYGCTAAARNRKEHAKFLSLLESLKRQYQETGPSRVLALEIEAKLLAWLVFHIKGTDRQLYGYATAIGELEIN
jgi:hemerythrin-like metal-binding protein